MGPQRGARFVAGLAVALVAVLTGSDAAPASTFSVNRTQIFLSAKTRSEMLTVRNDGAAPVRVQLRVFAWDQGPQGDMHLLPSRDIVFFPPLFSLRPGERRNVRVGTTTPPGPAERTYRIFIEELPSSDQSLSPRPGEVRVLMRMGIPIFQQPAVPVASSRIERLRLDRGRLAFALRNTGSVHVLATTIRITGLAASGETVLEGALDGWYVLAGGIRAYELPLPADRCSRLSSVLVEVHTAQGVLTETMGVSAAVCTP